MGVLPRASAAIAAAVYAGRRRGLGAIAHGGNQTTKNEGANRNFVFSPFSILLVFAVAMRGARGRTVEEMERLLPLGDLGALLALTTYSNRRRGDEEGATVGGAEVSEGYSLNGSVTELDVVSRIYVDDHLASNMYFKAFMDALMRECNTAQKQDEHLAVQLIDCSTAEETAAKINAFVADATRGHITDLVSADLISPSTRLLMVSAAFFKSPWRTPFFASQTSKGLFYAADYSPEEVAHGGEESVPGQKVEEGGSDQPQGFASENEPRVAMQNVDIMHVRLHSPGSVYYVVDEYVQAVGLPYLDGRYVMYVVQPNDPRKLDNLMKFKGGRGHAEGLQESSFPTLDDFVRTMRESERYSSNAEVHLSLPKFTLKSADNYVDLIPLFVHLLRIQAPFDSTIADFSGISGDHTLFVSAFVHQAGIEVDEMGTVATAATMGGIALRSAFMPNGRVDITINKPFAFQIRFHPDEGRATAESHLGDYVLFTGCITDALAAQQ